MRFISYLIFILLLVTACEESKFDPTKAPCEAELFSQANNQLLNSSTLTIKKAGVSLTSDISGNDDAGSIAAAWLEPEAVSLSYIIEKTHNVLQGQFTVVDLSMPNNGLINDPIGGFEFMIKYDASAISFMGADPGYFITNCGWEYFTYRTGPFGNCGTDCPSGLVKLVGLAETNNGAYHPSCFDNENGDNQLAKLKFYVTNDRNYECGFIQIKFFWLDCADNSVSGPNGTKLYWGKRVFDYSGRPEDGAMFDRNNYSELARPNADDFPSIYGPTATCDSIAGTKFDISNEIEFFNGGIDIVCADSIDARGDRGDLNLDGIAYTVADAVMFSNYFIEGIGALYYSDHILNGVVVGYARSVAASDVNGDGFTLTVADLVFMIRVIVGDEMPYPTSVTEIDANLTITPGGKYTIDKQIGAAHLVLEGEITPVLLAYNMELKYSFDGENTRVLIWSLDAKSFTGEFLQANADLISVELASSVAEAVNIKMVPTVLVLEQNEPNPFSGVTTIRFALAAASDYSIWIYSEADCEIVATYSGSAEAGFSSIEWDASEVSPGDYTFRVTAGEFSERITMTVVE